jgi:HD superfamily phosphohydrolase
VDFVFPNHEHDYHEQQRDQVIAASDLPEVFARHNLDWRYVSEAENFILLEQPLPALCADRLDYFLRDAVTIGLVSSEQATWLLGHLVVSNGRIVVDDAESALRLGDLFLATDDHIYTSVQEVGWYAVMAEALRVALEAGVIAEADLWQTDRLVLDRLRAAHLPAIDRWLDLLRPDVQFVRDDARPDLVVLPKVRTIDPPVLQENCTVQLCELDPGFAARKTAHLASKQGKWGLRIENRP